MYFLLQRLTLAQVHGNRDHHVVCHLHAGGIGVEDIDIDTGRGDEVVPEGLPRSRAAVTLALGVYGRYADRVLDNRVLGVQAQPALAVFAVHIFARQQRGAPGGVYILGHGASPVIYG